MKHALKKLPLSFLIIFILLIFVNSNLFSFGFSETGKNMVDIQTYVISDFGDEYDQSNNIIWKPVFSRYALPANMEDVNSGWDTNACNVTYMEAKPQGLPKKPKRVDLTQKYCLGVKAQFIKKGYNWIELYPMKTKSGNILGKDNKPDPNQDATNFSMYLPGVIQNFDLWVWGGNYNYWLEIYVKDFRGFLHRLNAGNINFVGWKSLRTKVPKTIPQAEAKAPFFKPVILDRIKVWSYPDERTDQFYVYFDYFQIQTDVYMEIFNGDELAEIKW